MFNYNTILYVFFNWLFYERLCTYKLKTKPNHCSEANQRWINKEDFNQPKLHFFPAFYSTVYPEDIRCFLTNRCIKSNHKAPPQQEPPAPQDRQDGTTADQPHSAWPALVSREESSRLNLFWNYCSSSPGKFSLPLLELCYRNSAPWSCLLLSKHCSDWNTKQIFTLWTQNFNSRGFPGVKHQPWQNTQTQCWGWDTALCWSIPVPAAPRTGPLSLVHPPPLKCSDCWADPRGTWSHSFSS